MCGLKPSLFLDEDEENQVTPFVGVWIETEERLVRCRLVAVTPFVGVWIETCRALSALSSEHRHTLRGCVD